MKAIDSTPLSMRELVESIEIKILGSGQFHHFQRLYRNDRIAFVYDIMPSVAKTITPYQLEILGYYDSGYNRVAVRGPHGLGKTFLASILTHHSVLTCESDGKVITTASAWRQLEHYLWPEIHKLSKAIYWTEVGRVPYENTELFNLAIKMGGVVEAFAAASDDYNTIEGAHATQLFYIFDEAKAIPVGTWDAAEGAFSNAGLRVENLKLEQFELDDSINDTVLHPDNNDVEFDMGKEGNIELENGDYNWQYSNTVLPVETDSIEIDSGIEGRIELENQVYDIDSNSVIVDYKESEEDIVKDDKEGIVESNVLGNKSYMPSNSCNKPAIDIHHHSMSNLPNNTQPTISAGQSVVVRKAIITSNKTPIIKKEINSNTYQALAFAISTPGEPSGRFYDIHMHKPGYEDWITRHVTIDEAILAGRISPDWVKQRELQWGIDSSIFQNRVLGEFADTSEEGIIPLSWVRAAVVRWKLHFGQNKKLDGKFVFGVDVARAGDDKTVIAERHAWVISHLHYMSKMALTSIAGKIESLSSNASPYINIEMDGGLGAGVYDILKQDGISNLRPIIVSGSTSFRDRSKELHFANVRAAMWWNLRELLDPQYDSELMLPPDDRLKLDLISPRWTVERKAVVVLESKLTIKSRIGRSTDSGDAVCLAFWNQSSGGGVVR